MESELDCVWPPHYFRPHPFSVNSFSVWIILLWLDEPKSTEKAPPKSSEFAKGLLRFFVLWLKCITNTESACYRVGSCFHQKYALASYLLRFNWNFLVLYHFECIYSHFFCYCVLECDKTSWFRTFYALCKYRGKCKRKLCVHARRGYVGDEFCMMPLCCKRERAGTINRFCCKNMLNKCNMCKQSHDLPSVPSILLWRTCTDSFPSFQALLLLSLNAGQNHWLHGLTEVSTSRCIIEVKLFWHNMLQE